MRRTFVVAGLAVLAVALVAAAGFGAGWFRTDTAALDETARAATAPATPDAATPDPAPTSGAPTPSATPSDVPAGALLPDLRSLPAEEVAIEVLAGGERRLRFTSSLANVGAGPLELVPDDLTACPVEQRHASQRLYVDGNRDGAYARTVDVASGTRAAGCMLDHPTHDHWHFEAMASYQLFAAGADEPVVQRDKVSFCLRDNETAAGLGTTQPQHYGECTGRLSLQGISPGWVDVYRSDLPGQVLDLPAAMPDGAYCLRSTVDPFDRVVESREGDNSAVLPLRITGTAVSPVLTSEAFAACR